jgi:hypothetical protein
MSDKPFVSGGCDNALRQETLHLCNKSVIDTSCAAHNFIFRTAFFAFISHPAACVACASSYHAYVPMHMAPCTQRVDLNTKLPLGLLLFLCWIRVDKFLIIFFTYSLTVFPDTTNGFFSIFFVYLIIVLFSRSY